MFKLNRSTVLTRSAVAVLAIFGAGVVTMGAQTGSQTVPAAQQPSTQAQPVNVSVPTIDTSSDLLFSSSATGEDATPVTEASLHPTVVNFAEAMQYGGGQRKRYGRTRYRGSNTNADGSSKWIFFGGAGLSQPIGNTFHYLNPSYGIQVGGGRQFNKHFAVPIQFDYDHFGFAKATLDNQFTVENSPYVYDGQLQSIDGSTHVWSFSIDPTYTFLNAGETHDGMGAYVVAGAGFYHKVANFTTPETIEGEDYYGDLIEYTANETIDHYTSNAPGFSGGFGLTYKFSRFSNERFYFEARYVFIDNSQRYGYNVNTIPNPTPDSIARPAYSAASPDPNNLYAPNSNRTTYIPIKVGIRF
jgi:hypothetical protein